METEYLSELIEHRIWKNADLRTFADNALERARSLHPSFERLMLTPQSPNTHTEGPFVKDHLRLALMVFYAVRDGLISFLEIEELARMKGYEGKLEKLEWILKENCAFFETYILCHDIGKAQTAVFSSKEGSFGAKLGFTIPIARAWEENDRETAIAEYLNLYNKFAREHGVESPSNIQYEFFNAYGISIHYHGHAYKVFDPILREAVLLCARSARLNDYDIPLLFDLISNHIDAISLFHESAEVKNYEIFEYQAVLDGRNPESVLAFMQICMFLDDVAGTKKWSGHGTWHNPTAFVNFLISEHSYEPMRLEEAKKEMEAIRKKNMKNALRGAELDGGSVMKLFNIPAGKELGNILRVIEDAFEGVAQLPQMPQKIRAEVEHRLEIARGLLVQ